MLDHDGAWRPSAVGWPHAGPDPGSDPIDRNDEAARTYCVECNPPRYVSAPAASLVHFCAGCEQFLIRDAPGEPWRVDATGPDRAGVD